MTPPAHLEARGLVVERGLHAVVDGFGFDAAGGALVHLKGPNGSGKTTVLRTLAGLITPAAGEVRWRGRAIGADTDFPAALSFVGHLPGLSAELDPRENLAFQAALARAPRRTSVDQALAELGAARFAARPVRQLSAGQRQRVALARLALFDAPLWMLDEPFTALDQSGRGLLEALIDAHLDRGGIVVIATHQDFRCRHREQVLALDGAAG